jgi:hypothetical protein
MRIALIRGNPACKKKVIDEMVRISYGHQINLM